MAETELEAPAMAPAAVVNMAERIRQEFHPHLRDATIRYVFIPHGPVKNGVVRLGVAKRLSAINALLMSADFTIVLSHDRWVTMTGDQRQALLDHELCHCAEKLDKDGVPDGWAIRHHDIEEFSEVVNRHGLLWPAQRDYARKTHRQLELFLAAEPAPATPGGNR